MVPTLLLLHFFFRYLSEIIQLFGFFLLTWKPKQMVGMTLKVEAQELILDTQEDVQEPTVFVPFYIVTLINQ